MQPVDQAVVAFVVAAFVIFSAAMVYATFLGPRKERASGKIEKK